MEIKREKLEQFKIDFEKITAVKDAIYGLDDLNINGLDYLNICGYYQEEPTIEDGIGILQKHIELLYHQYIKIVNDYYGENIIIQAALDKLEDYAQ